MQRSAQPVRADHIDRVVADFLAGHPGEERRGGFLAPFAPPAGQADARGPGRTLSRFAGRSAAVAQGGWPDAIPPAAGANMGVPFGCAA